MPPPTTATRGGGGGRTVPVGEVENGAATAVGSGLARHLDRRWGEKREKREEEEEEEEKGEALRAREAIVASDAGRSDPGSIATKVVGKCHLDG